MLEIECLTWSQPIEASDRRGREDKIGKRGGNERGEEKGNERGNELDP